MRLPLVLLYHVIAPCPADADGEERGLFIEPGSFEKQMNSLAARGFRTLTLDQFAAAMSVAGPPRSVVLTFDDAYAHIDAVVSPILRRLGFSAVMFACPAHLGGRNTWDAPHPNLSKLAIATQDDLARMSEGPWEIASHGQRHVDLRNIDPQQRRLELIGARQSLARITRKAVVDLAYPYGYEDAGVRMDVRAAGYRMAFLENHTPMNDALRLARRPIRGTDSAARFRLKTSRCFPSLRRVRDISMRLAG